MDPDRSRGCSFGTRHLFLLAAAFSGWGALGCAGRAAAPDPPVAGELRDPDGPPSITFTLPGPDASHYDQREPAALSGLEARIFALVSITAGEAGVEPPSVDQAVQGATRAILLGLVPNEPPPSPLVEFALRSHGMVDPPPHFLIALLPPGAEATLIEQLRGRLAPLLAAGRFRRVGIAVGEPSRQEDRRHLVIALFESRLTILPPLPRRLSVGQEVDLTLIPERGHVKLALIITDPDGEVSDVPLVEQVQRFKGRLSCTDPGVLQVEVTGEGPIGAEVLANFPCYCGVDPPVAVSYSPSGARSLDETVLAEAIFQETNRLRHVHGLPPLKPSEAVAQVALQHSQDMRDEGFVGHVSPKSGSDPAQRLVAAGITARAARENVARAYSVDEVMRELMRSPAHRRNILSEDVTVLGVGVAVDHRSSPPMLLVTQNFIEPAAAYDPARVQGDIQKIIARRRSAAGLPPLRLHDRLTALAEAYVTAIVDGGESVASADGALKTQLDGVGDTFGRIEGVLLRVGVLEALAAAPDIARRDLSHVGIGARKQGAQIVVFILMGKVR